MKLNNLLKYGLPLLGAAILLWYAYKDTDFSQMGDDLVQCNPFWLLLTIPIQFIAHLSRARRWQLLLEPLGNIPSLKNTFIAVMAGYFGNLILPRMGEVTRCGVLYNTNNIPLTDSGGTVVAERAIDVLTLGLVLGLGLMFEYELLGGFLLDILGQKKDVKEGVSGLMILGFALGLGSVGVAVFWLLRARLLAIKPIAKIWEIVTKLFLAVMSIFRLKRSGEFVLHSVLIWTCYWLTHLFFMKSFGATADLVLSASLITFIAGTMGMIAPVQGGVGAYHFMVAAAFTGLYNLTDQSAKSFAFLSHTGSTLFLLIVGGICFVLGIVISAPKTPNSSQTTPK